MERLSTGNVRLDEVLGGGLVLDAITLVVGAPGTGKTILSEQCVFANATPERPGLYLSTVSEPFDKLLRYGQSLDFFETAQLGRSVFYDDLGDALHQHGLPAVLERLDTLIKAHHPGIVVIDSFKALRTFAPSDAEFRRFLYELAGRLTVVAVSSLWVGEYEPDEATNAPEFAVADAVIGLEMRRSAERAGRYLSVRKLRGGDFLSGDHVYRITSSGLVIFPRLADLRDGTAYSANGQRVSSGIAALDDALEDGYWSGSTTLIAGPSGAGKSLMGLHFVFAGAAQDEPGVYMTLQENRPQLARVIGRFGWTIDNPNVTIMDRSPVDLYVDELVYELLDRDPGNRRPPSRRRQPQRPHRRHTRPHAPPRVPRTHSCNAAPGSESASCSRTRPRNCSGSPVSTNSACPTSPTTSSSSNTSKTAPRCGAPSPCSSPEDRELGGHQRVHHLRRRHCARSATRPSPVLGLSLIDLEVGGMAAESSMFWSSGTAQVVCVALCSTMLVITAVSER